MSAIEGKYGEVTTEKKQFHPGEPIFILRAQDPLASEAVEWYAAFCEMHGCSNKHVQECMAAASRMELWQKENPRLVKGLPG